MVALPILPAPQLLQTPHPPQPPAPQIPPGGRCSWWRCRFFRRCSSCVHRCPFGARILELLQVPQTLLLPPILPAPPPAGGSIDRIASAVGRSVLFVRIFGGDHPFPFLSFPFLSFPFLSPALAYAPLSALGPSLSWFGSLSPPRCISDPVRRTAVLTARDAGAGMFERFSSAGCPRTSSSRDGVSVPGRAGKRPHATLYRLCLRRPRVGALSSVMTYLYLYMAAEEAPATVWRHRSRYERAEHPCRAHAKALCANASGSARRALFSKSWNDLCSSSVIGRACLRWGSAASPIRPFEVR